MGDSMRNQEKQVHELLQHPHSIRLQIILWSMGFATMVALAVSIMSYGYLQRSLKLNQEQSTRINLQLLRAEIDRSLDKTITFANWTRVDPTISTYLSQMVKAERLAESGENANSENSAGRIFKDYRKLSLSTWEHFNNEYNSMGTTEYIQRAVVATPKGKHFLQSVQNSSVNSSIDLAEKLMKTPYFDTLLQNQDYRFIGICKNPLNEFYNTEIIPLVRPITSVSSSDVVGFVYLEISPKIITDAFDSFKMESDAALYITIGEGHSYLYKDGVLREHSLPENTISTDLSTPGFRLSILPSEAMAASRSRHYFYTVCFIFLAIAFSGFFLVMSLSRSITRPIIRLLEHLKVVGQGDFRRDRDIEWDNELGAIGRGINDLSENVKMLMDKKVQDEKERQELEYQILQSQINPHFLYNTLNTIKWMATIQGSDGIADMSTALSRLLKNIAKSRENLITLREELSLVKDYFTIMKYRYGGTIDMELVITDDSVYDARVNRFSLQPIVENAIFHGIEPKGGTGIIRITAERMEQEDGQILLVIKIWDNGIGMDQEQIRNVLNGDAELSNDFFRHLGVSNVNRRIKHSFGSLYGISILSEPGEYTETCFTLPYRTEKNNTEIESRI